MSPCLFPFPLSSSHSFFYPFPTPHARYRSAVKGRWSKHFWAVLCSAFHQLGTFFYWGTEWSDGFIHQPALVRLNREVCREGEGMSKGLCLIFSCSFDNSFFLLSLVPLLQPQDWPPRFNTYLKLKYFWFVFVFLNGIWVVIPFYIYYRAYRQLDLMIEKKQR